MAPVSFARLGGLAVSASPGVFDLPFLGQSHADVFDVRLAQREAFLQSSTTCENLN
jgi:hypothetical protein